MKKVLVIITSILLVIGLTGCGSSQSVTFKNVTFSVPDGWDIAHEAENYALYSSEEPTEEDGNYNNCVTFSVKADKDLKENTAEKEMEDHISQMEKFASYDDSGFHDLKKESLNIDGNDGKALTYKLDLNDVKKTNKFFIKEFLFTKDGVFYNFEISTESKKQTEKIFDELVSSIKFE